MPKRPKKSKFERLPKGVRKIIEAARAGRKVCKAVRQKETGSGDVTFFFEPGGKSIPPVAAQKAIKSGFLVPSQDGLFEGTDQTWMAVVGAE